MELKIAKEFTTAPGPRHRSEGRFSGELFREAHLLPAVRKAIEANDVLTIYLDGTSGFGTSFLEESFGGLIRVDQISLEQLRKTLIFVSIEEPDLVDEINEYMDDASAEELNASAEGEGEAE